MTLLKFQPATLLALERLAFAIQQKTSCIRVLERALASERDAQVQDALNKAQRALERDLFRLASVVSSRE